MDNLAEIFAYLDDLRESGVTNMFGAGPYVQEDFGLDRKAAGEAVTAWMKTFDRVSTPEARAASTSTGGR